MQEKDKIRKKMKKYINILFILLVANYTFAQDEDETIGSEVVNVVKAYTPTISDAYKVKETPDIDSQINIKKDSVSFGIFSVPVASTFTPDKGKAANVVKQKRERLYDNYVSLGLGNYMSALLDFWYNNKIDRNTSFGANVHHHSSQGGVKDALLKDAFMENALELVYKKQNRHMGYYFGGGFANDQYNWYGVPSSYPQTMLDAIDPKHSYNTISLGGGATFDDGVFKGGKLGFQYFVDSEKSSESQLFLKPEFEFPIAGELITTIIAVDYLNGKFDTQPTATKYGFTNLGFTPSFVVLRDNLTLHLGAQALYAMNTVASTGKFYLYPKIEASYRLSGEKVIAYGTLDGALKQNSYRAFVAENPFLIPNLTILQTNKQYEGVFGLKGKLNGNVSYDISGSYQQEYDKAFFHNNMVTAILPLAPKNYQNGNAFEVLYDDVSTLKLAATLNFKFSKAFKLKATVHSYTYSLKNFDEAWNLPKIDMALLADYQISDKWSSGFDIFYTGSRSDYSYDVISSTDNIHKLKAFTDVNARLNYNFNDRLGVYLKGNNLLGTSYARWQNYPTQGIQVMAGVKYKFDF